MLSKQISILLSDLTNSSLTTGTFPTKLKVSKVNPLHKKGSNLDSDNYRPVSLLSVFSIIYEKVMYARLYNFWKIHSYSPQSNLVSEAIILQTMH